MAMIMNLINNRLVKPQTNIKARNRFKKIVDQNDS